jgi:hypothetical protein
VIGLPHPMEGWTVPVFSTSHRMQIVAAGRDFSQGRAVHRCVPRIE